MFGHEQKTDMNTPNLEPVHSYSEEDCKSTLMSFGLWSFKDGGQESTYPKGNFCKNSVDECQFVKNWA